MYLCVLDSRTQAEEDVGSHCQVTYGETCMQIYTHGLECILWCILIQGFEEGGADQVADGALFEFRLCVICARVARSEFRVLN